MHDADVILDVKPPASQLSDDLIEGRLAARTSSIAAPHTKPRDILNMKTVATISI
jgi:hypothetical protein